MARLTSSSGGWTEDAGILAPSARLTNSMGGKATGLGLGRVAREAGGRAASAFGVARSRATGEVIWRERCPTVTFSGGSDGRAVAGGRSAGLGVTFTAGAIFAGAGAMGETLAGTAAGGDTLTLFSAGSVGSLLVGDAVARCQLIAFLGAVAGLGGIGFSATRGAVLVFGGAANLARGEGLGLGMLCTMAPDPAFGGSESGSACGADSAMDSPAAGGAGSAAGAGAVSTVVF